MSQHQTESSSVDNIDAGATPAQSADDPATAKYWPQLNGLRAIAIAFVFIAHVDPFPTPNSAFGLAFGRLSAASVFAVDQFFLLSAFLLTMLLLREKEKFGAISFKQYFIRRALRIWPLYFCAVFAGCILLPVFSGKLELQPFSRHLLEQFIPLATFTFNYAITFTQNTLYLYGEKLGMPLVALLIPLWSISAEEQFYAACPFIAQKMQFNRRLLFWLIVAIVMSTALRLILCHVAWQNKISHFLWFFNTFARVEPFIAGILIAATLYFARATQTGIRNSLPIVICSGILIWALIIFLEPMNVYVEAALIPLVALAAAANLLASLYWRPAIEFLSTRPMFYLGQLSFSMYVLHKPILWALARMYKGHLPPTESWWLTAGTGYLATFLAANITYHLIEKRFLSMKTKLFARQRETPAR